MSAPSRYTSSRSLRHTHPSAPREIRPTEARQLALSSKLHDPSRSNRRASSKTVWIMNRIEKNCSSVDSRKRNGEMNDVRSDKSGIAD